MGPSRSTVVAVAAGSLLALGVGAAAVLSGTGALAASPSPTPTASGSATPGYGPGKANGPGARTGDRMGKGGPGGFGLGRLGGTMLHGEVVVQKADGSGTETLLVQRGTVTAKDGSTVTVKSTDGFTVVWTVTSDTLIRAGKAPSSSTPSSSTPSASPTPSAPPAQRTKPANGTLADVAVGATVDVVGTKTGDGTGAARSLGGRPAGVGAGTDGSGGHGGPGSRHRGSGGQQQSPAPSPTAGI